VSRAGQPQSPRKAPLDAREIVGADRAKDALDEFFSTARTFETRTVL